MTMDRQSLPRRLWQIAHREIKNYNRRPLFLFTMLIAPLVCLVFFTSLMGAGLPTKLPAGLVDEDDTHISRIVVRILGSMQETNFTHRYSNFSEAREAMQRGEIYSFFYIPKGLTEDAIANRQPRLSFYTNEAYYLPGTMLMKDSRYACELAGLALTRETLYGKGMTEDQARAVIQPLVIETHPLGNPYLNYSVYLNNIILPGILILLIMLCATYAIGHEWKRGTQRELYALAGNSSTVALAGKLLPQTLIFTLMFMLYDVVFYRFLGFPCNAGIVRMMVLGFITVLAAQAFGVFLFGVFAGKLRLSMCLCSLWGILAFSLAGFTYPVPAMHGFLQGFSWFFPLRQYYLIYVNQALDGNSIFYVWRSVTAMLLYVLLPVTVLWRYRYIFLKAKYIE
ncbi:MAG: ABC transporter permease [Bacteroidales bacterium]|nr:ABC transporter permease [Bacteroidales bacterium]